MLNIVNTLQKHNKEVPDSFPIQINPFKYTIEGEALDNWQEKNNISKGKTAEQVFYEFKEKYEIKNDNLEDTRKIIALRYEIAKTGYSSTRAVRLADNLYRK